MTVLCCRRSLGWTLRRSAYCQMLREVNKAMGLEWALEKEGLDFDNVWTDECTVHLESQTFLLQEGWAEASE